MYHAVVLRVDHADFLAFNIGNVSSLHARRDSNANRPFANGYGLADAVFFGIDDRYRVLALVANDPQDGEVIRPTGGLGSFTEKTLVSGLARQLSEIVDMIRVGNYLGVEHLLYKGGVVRSKVEALARYEDFRKKRGNRPLGKGKEIDIGEEQRNPISDYVDEA